ncbi:hypothetical protein Sango_1964800 [Sesamum angolense]|uniref:PGG domain-containing protein n=1 Tax=Sesamum angolense TaxID=2727404 RepID=A0AAE1WEL6_9LAMI|nr:hypothetical protein Sango_1964800 [Sesamum angolense]
MVEEETSDEAEGQDLKDHYLLLYRAALQGNWEAAKQIFDDHPEAMTARIDRAKLTALHIAVGAGRRAIRFVKKLVALMPEDSIAAKDENGSTALVFAAAVDNKEAAVILVNRMPSLLYIQNKFGHKLLLYVIDAEFLVDIALVLVEKYPALARLKTPDNDSALKKITKKSNKEHRREEVAEPTSSKLVKCLCKEISSLSCMEAKGIYNDAMMLAAALGIHEVVEEFETHPTIIYHQTSVSGQYIFHVAVENRSEHVYNLIYQMSDHKHFYSDLCDVNGNNLLHLAAKLAPSHKLNEISGAALQMQREIQWYKGKEEAEEGTDESICSRKSSWDYMLDDNKCYRVEEVEKFVHPHSRERLNNYAKSPKMVFTEEHKILKEEGEKWMKDTSNSCTIAAALIATVMFAAAITVPGGNDNSNGFPIFSGSSAFIIFAISDAVSLFTSATSLLMFLAIQTSRYAEQDFLYVLPKRLIIGLGTLFLSICSMMVAFSATVYLVFARKEAWVLIPVGALACLPVTSFVLLQFPLFLDLVYSTYGPGIFGKQSNRPFY